MIRFAIVVVLSLTSAQALADEPKTAVCHRLGNGGSLLLEVPAKAAAALLARGDTPARTYWADMDGDGAGDPDAPTVACEAPFGYVDDASDCDDADPEIAPDAEDVCGDGIDEDCSGDDALCASFLDGWTIQAGRITAGATTGTITSSFLLTRLSGTTNARGGGSCLVADLVARGLGAATCATDADCLLPESYRSKGWFGYCARPDGSAESKRCWTRPGGPATHCRRSADVPERVFPEGLQRLPAPPGDAMGDGAPVRWMLLGCLAAESTPTACGGGNPSLYVRSLGPSATWLP